MRYGTDFRPFFLFAAYFGTVPLALFLFSLAAPIILFAELIVSFRLQVGLLMIPFALLFTISRARWHATIYSLATIWCLSPIITSYIPAYQPPPGPRQIKVVTFNVFHSNERFEAELRNIKQLDADILLITEYTDAWATELRELESIYAYHILEPLSHGFGIAMFSKFPLKDKETVNLKTTVRGTDVLLLKATAVIDDQSLRLIGIHTRSPSPEDLERVEERNDQIVQAAAQVGKNSEPTVLLGDLNCVPWSSFLKPLYQAGLRDSRRGFGYQATWHRLLKPLRIPIDHILVSDRIHVHEREIGHSSGSDHFPVIATISISPSN